jgi:secondary thiamine-phosphate synthase enzyme
MGQIYDWTLVTMQQIEVRTQQRQGFHDITPQLQTLVRDSGVSDGVCYVFCPHTTAGLTLNENWDPDVRHDMGLALDAISPARAGYRHAEGNSPAHVKSSLIGASQFVFIENGRLALGQWQGVYLAEFDGPRRRRVWVKVMGA